MQDSNPQAFLIQLGGGAAAPAPAQSAPQDLVRPQMMFFPISGATAPLQQK
jgi:hypothetical protein